MKIGLLSDTHNNLANLQRALQIFRDQDIQTLFHCGDLTEPEIAQALAGFQVICVLGNGDTLSGEIRRVLLALDARNYVGLVYRGELGGARIAATHGHLTGQVDELLRAGSYDYIFKGHSHQHKDERINGARLINPGALGGMRREARRVCVLDLASGLANFIEIDG